MLQKITNVLKEHKAFRKSNKILYIKPKAKDRILDKCYSESIHLV